MGARLFEQVRSSLLSRTILLLAACLFPAAAAAQPACAPLPPPSGPIVEVFPAQASQLRGIVAAARTGATILLHDGVYDLTHGDAADRLSFDTPGVVLRSASGKREAVVLEGGYGTNELVTIQASDVVIADLTIARAFDHPVHISGPSGQPIVGVILHNLVVEDPGQQAIKINPIDDGFVDDGVVECSLIKLTAAGRPHIRGKCYTGGIDAHRAWGWVVRRNRVEGFWCDEGLSEHGIHFWNASRDTIVEENVILDCARGVGFGLREAGGSRDYPDDPYPKVGYMGHIDGMIRNNFIAAGEPGLFASEAGFDTGIGLEQAHGAEVHHNSVASTQTPSSSSIEWRWSNTLAEISNNVATSLLKPRDGGAAALVTNLENAPLNWFSAIANGDLHLTVIAQPAIDGGTPLSPGTADADIDLESRDSTPDIGADELTEVIFSDGFESGDLSAWATSTP